MTITGRLTEFSLAEIFQFLEQGNKQGLLTVFEQPESNSPQNRAHYIWFNQGRIVAAADRADHRGLITMISQRGWLGNHAASRFAQQCSTQIPLGLYLKSQNILTAEQVKLLFCAQVMQRVCALFSLVDGWFRFDCNVILPRDEMTGLSAPATEVTLSGLRVLRDWSALESKLPDPASSIISVIKGKPELRLSTTEWQVWEFTGGHESIVTIARHLQLPVAEVQRIVFRLSVVGLIEDIVPETMPPETMLTTAMPMESDAMQEAVLSPAGATVSAAKAQTDTRVSHSFLTSLVGFLRSKT